MLEPPDRTMCEYSCARVSTAAAWMVWNSISTNIESREFVSCSLPPFELTCDARLFDIDKVRLEHAFWGLKPFGSHFDRTAVWKLIYQFRNFDMTICG